VIIPAYATSAIRPGSTWSRRRLALVEDPDLLRADRESLSIPLEDVGDADEAGDEGVDRLLVEIGRRADLARCGPR